MSHIFVDSGGVALLVPCTSPPPLQPAAPEDDPHVPAGPADNKTQIVYGSI